MKKEKSERLGQFLTLKTDVGIHILALFDDLFEIRSISKKKNIFLELIFEEKFAPSSVYFGLKLHH